MPSNESCLVATAPTVYGIETHVRTNPVYSADITAVATAPTVYGIETLRHDNVLLLK